ncbi:hypothetical protein HK096_003947 [Nowakowskiella sp. JEL0078]|nr:hypothetical protein HK096_003947 [Nowakowskiella sp. JEL0078]
MDTIQCVAQDQKATSRKKKCKPKNKSSADSFKLVDKSLSSPPHSPQKQQTIPHSENTKSVSRATSLKKNSHKQPMSSSSPPNSEKVENLVLPNENVAPSSQPQRRKSRRNKQKSTPPQNHSNGSSDSGDEKTLNQEFDPSPQKNNHRMAESFCVWSTSKPLRRLSSPDFPSTPSSLSSSTLYQQSNILNTTPQTQKPNFYAGAYFENSPAPSALPIPSFSNRNTPTISTSATQSQSLPTTIHNDFSRSSTANAHNRLSQHLNFHQTQNNPFYSPAAPMYESAPLPKLHPSTSTPVLNSFIDHGYATYPGSSNLYPFPTSYFSNPSPTPRDSGPDMFLMEDDVRVKEEMRKRSQDLLMLLGAAREKRKVGGVELERTLKDILKIQG